jgi:hypothetical protein
MSALFSKPPFTFSLLARSMSSGRKSLAVPTNTAAHGGQTLQIGVKYVMVSPTEIAMQR